MKNLTNRIAEIRTVVEYEDVDGIYYDCIGYVLINSSYEIEDVRLECIEAYDRHGNQIRPEMSHIIEEQLKTLAGAKALEKIESVDFCREAERE